MRLRYTLEAAAELDAILTYIEEKSPSGGQKVKRRIRAVTRLLLAHPHMGRQTQDRRLRRVAAFPYPFVIFYQRLDHEIVVHGVRHAAREPSTMPGTT